MSRLLSDINNFIQRNNLIEPNTVIIVGLSGGPDSVFLLHILNNYRNQGIIKKLIAAHLDHEWRKDSYKDEEFCKTIAEHWGIEFVSAKASALPSSFKHTGSKEDLGRRMRRFFLESIAQDYNADAIALAHHAQDQQETFFIRLIRGTTLSGLIGMKPKDGMYIRPLLETNKEDIINYLDANTIAYIIDPTNVSQDFLRNRIRLKVLPELQSADKRFDKNFLRTLENLQKTEDFLNKLTQEAFNAISLEKNGLLSLDAKKLSELDPFLYNRVILYWLIKEKVPFTPTEKFLSEIKRFLNQKGKEHRIHFKWSIKKENSNIYIKKN